MLFTNQMKVQDVSEKSLKKWERALKNKKTEAQKSYKEQNHELKRTEKILKE